MRRQGFREPSLDGRSRLGVARPVIGWLRPLLITKGIGIRPTVGAAANRVEVLLPQDKNNLIAVQLGAGPIGLVVDDADPQATLVAVPLDLKASQPHRLQSRSRR